MPGCTRRDDAWRATLRALLVALSVAGCAGEHISEPLFASELPRVAESYRSGYVRLRDGSVITRDRIEAAEVKLEVRRCETWQEELERKCADTSIPLDRLGTDPSQLTPGQEQPWRMRGLRVGDIERASLELDLTAMDDSERAGAANLPGELEEPRWGLGLAVLGPSLPLAVDGQWFASDHWVFQGGLMGTNGLFDGYLGLRIRPGVPQKVRPWFGGAAGFACAFGETDESDPEPDDDPCIAYGSARVGVDWSFDRGRTLLTPEVGLLIPTDMFAGIEMDVVPWAGVTVDRLF